MRTGRRLAPCTSSLAWAARDGLALCVVDGLGWLLATRDNNRGRRGGGERKRRAEGAGGRRPFGARLVSEGDRRFGEGETVRSQADRARSRDWRVWEGRRRPQRGWQLETPPRPLLDVALGSGGAGGCAGGAGTVGARAGGRSRRGGLDGRWPGWTRAGWWEDGSARAGAAYWREEGSVCVFARPA